MLLRDLLITTKDGDWGVDSPRDGFTPYRVIRGADFPEVRVGDTSTIPVRFLDLSTVVRRTLQPNDIIIETAGGNRDRPTGRTLLVTERLLNTLDLPATCASFCRFLRVDPNKADSRFVFWYLQQLYAQGEMWTHQVQHTGVARFQYTRFADSTDIPLPSPVEQRAIADTLCALDDKIELNRRMNETLEAIARAIFKSWFVAFDPIRAKAEGRQPFGMDAETAALFPDSLQDSSWGRIPKGWSVRGLDAVAHFLNGLALQKYPPRGDVSLPVIKIAQLRKGSTEGADRAAADLPPEYLVQDGDVLFSWSGSLEVVIWCGGRGALNQHLFKVTSQDYPKWFYYFWIQEHLPAFQAIASGKATTMGHIQRHHLTEASVLVPSAELVSAMDKIVSPMIQAIVANNLQSRALTDIRDALLPKLISGEIRVKDVNSTVEH